ncbi:MAG: thioredoxin family protein [Roseinatronobacter sp.]
MLTRRSLILTGLACAALPMTTQAAIQAYTPGLAEEAMRAGKRVVLIFGADWCSTCRRQERIMADLRAANPSYDRDLTLIRVDWDTHGTGALSRSLNVPRRSTLIALKGETELARIVAGTREAEIKALLDRALTA